MGQDSHLPLKKSGQSVIDRNLPYRFLRGQPLKSCFFRKLLTVQTGIIPAQAQEVPMEHPLIQPTVPAMLLVAATDPGLEAKKL